MAINSSYHTLAEQIINFNDNVVDVLSKITNLISSNESSITFTIKDSNGVDQDVSMPSFGFLKNEIQRLNTNVNSIYSLNEAGALIQPTDGTKFRRIVTVSLNREPNDLNNLSIVNTFYPSKNWFFDSLLNPQISIELDLTGKVENNVRKILCRRYIVEFEKDGSGGFTPVGQGALNSFNTGFRDKNTFTLNEFLNWHENTPGVLMATEPTYDEQMFDLEPSFLDLDGYFTVLKIEEDLLNKKLFYHVNTTNYVRNIKSGDEFVPQQKQLVIGDEVIINSVISNTRYKIIEISTAQSNPRLRFERIEGVEPIPVGTNVLKVYSSVTYSKRVRVSVGYDERNVVFVKAMNMDNYIMSKNWSTGVGFWTLDLRESTTNVSLEQYYVDNVKDYGAVLKDLSNKKIPNTLSATPQPPELITTNFRVVQVNQHLTDTPDSLRLKELNSQQQSLKSEITSIEESIRTINAENKTTDRVEVASRQQFASQLDTLVKRRESRNRLLSSVTSQIIDLSKSPQTHVEPKYRVRGFWNFPDSVIFRGTRPQEVVQFKVRYRYLSRDGRETTIEPFNISTANTETTVTAAFSNWIEMKTDARRRILDKATGQYYWETQDITNADVPNINQIDLPIQANEKIEMKISSISEVGWPESPVESGFGTTITVEFPDNLANVMNENEIILKSADKEDVRINVLADLSARGLDDHLADQVTVNGITYFHSTDKVLSGFKDENGLFLDLFAYLQRLETKIKALEEKVNKIKGVLQVVVNRAGQEFLVRNGQEVKFTVQLEDYLDSYTAPNVQSGRVYKNDIYVIKDFVLVVRNTSVDSPLGIISSRNYNATTNSDVYNSGAPQVFWVNSNDQLLVDNTSGSTKTQLNNQFIWAVNYDKVNNQNSVIKLGQNIANNFGELKDTDYQNSVTDVLSSDSFNLGYGENEVLSFVGNNLSLFDSSKWIENSDPTVASLNKLLTTIHPQIPNLESIQETNSDKVKTLDGGFDNEIRIPLNIYFKMNSVDPTRTDLNYNYINLNGNNVWATHVKKLKFFMENEAENNPFSFTITFSLNRAKTILPKSGVALAGPSSMNVN